MIPFLALPLTLTYRRLPLTTLALAAVSIVEMVALTVTRPLSAAVVGDWFDRFAAGDFSRTAVDLAGGSSRTGIYLLLAAIALAVTLTALATPLPAFSREDALAACVGIAGWVVVERRGAELLESSLLGTGNGAYVTALVGTAIVLVSVMLPRLVDPGSPRRRR
jgi:hypothetical protein